MTDENHPVSARTLFVRVLILLVVFANALALDAFRPQGYFSVNGLSYNSSKAAPYEIRTPADFPSSFDLRFDVLANSAKNRDILQASGPSESALRLTIEPPSRLIMSLFGIDTVPVTLTHGFALHRWHHVAISGIYAGNFDVTVDGSTRRFAVLETHQLQSSAEIGYRDFAFRFARIEIGAGEGSIFKGKIAKLSFSSRYVKVVPWPLAVLGSALVAGAVLWLMLPWLRRIRVPELSRWDLVILAAVAVTTLLGFLGAAVGLPNGDWLILLAMAAGAVLGVVLVGRFHRESLPLPQVVSIFISVCLTIVAAASLLTLPNSIVAARMFGRWPLASAFTVTFIVCVAALVLDAASRKSSPSRIGPWLPWLPYLLFGLLALRTDSVFSPINVLHWEYVLGPIRALREGGWLLWDVPSQYGFLNVLIPAALPVHPAVNAFYWFQSLAFFVASATFYRTLYRVLGVNWIAACALVVAFFFLADPLLIGPTPYPSMSAVRFLWCYVLLAVAASNFLGERPSAERFARLGTLPWVLGLLWSAESAIYTTVIFFTPLFVSLIFFQRATPLRARLRAALGLFVRPFLCAFAAFAVVEAIYFLALGHGPDWSMYIAYIRSYGAGFGERPIPFYGPAWFVASILFGGAAAFALARRNCAEGPACAAATALALVWIVSSYYFGRAFPIIVTMLSPLFVFATFTIIRAGSALGGIPVLTAISVPMVALGLVSAFWNANAPAVFPRVAKPNVNAWLRLPQANPELASLLTKVGVSRATPVVYYDYWVGMPRAADGPYDRNWLPTPLQELDDPIPVAVRDKIVTRFVERHRIPGYLVQVTGEDDIPVLDAKPWITLLSRFYDVTEVAHSPNYRILEFALRAPPQ